MKMSSDGHGWIGRLTLRDGRCVNVSLPTGISAGMADQAPRPMTVVGKVWPYYHDDPNDTEITLAVEYNHRRVGYGNCDSDFFVFVK